VRVNGLSEDELMFLMTMMGYNGGEMVSAVQNAKFRNDAYTSGWSFNHVRMNADGTFWFKP
jgi:hypothetical protein